MADLAASDVTYTILNRRRTDGLNYYRVRLAFGDGALTVPAGGIPLTKGNLGCPNVIQSLNVVDQGTSGYKFQFDQSEEKLVVMQAPAQTHDHDFKVIGGGTIVTDGGLGADSSGDLVKVEAGDLTIEGADSATDGGVLSETLAAAALAEASAVAIAAQTIEVEAIGW